MKVLLIDNMSVSYNIIDAVKSIHLEVADKKIVTLLGANGAGKTTTLSAISKLVRLKSGKIVYNGEDITRLSAKQVVERGIVMVPEGRRVFADMTVAENLLIGAYLRKDDGIPRDMDYVYEIFPILRERSKQLAGTLSGGEQQMLAVGRALMTKPRLLLMDEPSLGLAPILVKSIFEIIKRINEEEGIPVLLIEQNVNYALKIATYGYVLENGSIQLEGTGKQLLGNDKVRALYLGIGD